jgi:hypothetical protein
MSHGQELRELRAWHWKEVQRNRRHEERFNTIGPANRAATHKRIADFHEKAVRTLNQLFPIGDDVTKDSK